MLRSGLGPSNMSVKQRDGWFRARRNGKACGKVFSIARSLVTCSHNPADGLTVVFNGDFYGLAATNYVKSLSGPIDLCGAIIGPARIMVARNVHDGYVGLRKPV